VLRAQEVARVAEAQAEEARVAKLQAGLWWLFRGAPDGGGGAADYQSYRPESLSAPDGAAMSYHGK
jgi:hypothetical protein